MSNEKPPQRQRPERVTGIRHVIAAAGYSINGFKILRKETAFRHITLALFPCLLLFYAIGANVIEFCTLLILFALLVAVEALNAAIECIVDHLAPDWQEFARDAKDLGSLATLCMLLANGTFLSVMILRFFEVL